MASAVFTIPWSSTFLNCHCMLLSGLVERNVLRGIATLACWWRSCIRATFSFDPSRHEQKQHPAVRMASSERIFQVAGYAD